MSSDSEEDVGESRRPPPCTRIVGGWGETRPIACVDVGAATHIMRKAHQEDAYTIIDPFGGKDTQGYFAVYDGHGGDQAVSYIAKNFHLLFEEKLREARRKLGDARARDKSMASLQGLLTSLSPLEQPVFEGGKDAIASDRPPVLGLLEQCFRDADQKLAEMKVKDGSTGTLFFLRGNSIYLANIGDSTGYLLRGGMPVHLTVDFNFSANAGEQRRVKDAGGNLIRDRSHRVRAYHQPTGKSLAVSRSIGDHEFKSLVASNVILNQPHTAVVDLKPEDSHFVIASDGLWDVIKSGEMTEAVLAAASAQDAADELMRMAHERKTRDNTTVIVVALQYHG